MKIEYLYCTLIGYLIGAFNPSYLLSKIRGFDIRKRGSGNAGASNALIIFGKVWGTVCAVIDIAKAYFSIFLTEFLFSDFAHALTVTGAACILGHAFPFYMRFRGGKGLACLAGLILYFDWRVFLIMLAAEIAVALISDYICLVPVTASAAFPIIYAILTKDFWGTLILLSVTVIIFIRHIGNFKRIKNGAELRLSYLWKPHAEADRLKENNAALEEEIEDHFSGRHAMSDKARAAEKSEKNNRKKRP